MNPGVFYEAARDYLAMGLHPIPCAPRSKRPLVEWRPYQTEPPLPEELAVWWGQWPDANVALVLGRGIFAVDLDGGQEAERLLGSRGVFLPGAPRSKTAHGYHVFLASERPVPDRVGLLTTGGRKPQVDIRGVGIVVVPPSVHPEGPVYTWEIPLSFPLPSAPERLLALIFDGKSPEAMPGHGREPWIAEALRGVPEGQRDVTCTRLAGYFLGIGLDPKTVEVLLAESFARNCTPPFAVPDVRKCVQSVARRERVSDLGDRPVQGIKVSVVLDRLLEILGSGSPPVIPTPFPALNHFLSGGFSPGELVYVGARPGVGKSSMGLEFARHAAARGINTLIVSREMAALALARRLLAQAARVRASALKTASLEEGEWWTVREALPKLRGLPIWISDDAVSIGEITDLVAGFQEPIQFLLVDYLQLVRAPRDIKERRLQVEAVSQALKTLAVQFQLSVVCLSSLARPVSGKEDARPSLASLRESGELEHDADVVLLLRREALKAETECIVAKNRDGRQGIANLMFRSEFVAFDEAARRKQEEDFS